MPVVFKEMVIKNSCLLFGFEGAWLVFPIEVVSAGLMHLFLSCARVFSACWWSVGVDVAVGFVFFVGEEGAFVDEFAASAAAEAGAFSVVCYW
jgi:hypothetical protein